MKKLLYILPLVLLVFACGGQSGGSVNTKGVTLENVGDSISYSMGMSVVQNITESFEGIEGETFSEDAFRAGINEGLMKDGRFTDQENQELMMKFQVMYRDAQMAKQKADGEKGRIEGEKFLAENAQKDGVKTTDSGLQYKVEKEGSGASPSPTDRVKVHYEGKLINGKIFDSSLQKGEPVSFGLNQVIPGWTEGLQLMQPGAKFTFYIPGHLAYGERGSPPDIPANSTLIFNIELIEVLK